MPEVASRAAVGRPRDPEVDARVHDAACRLYGRTGWAGFSIEAVARDAGVGKAAIYRRWSSKAALLTDALTAQLPAPEDVDTGTLRGDLLELGGAQLELYSGRFGEVALRLRAEGRVTEELIAQYAVVRQAQVLAARAVVRRAIRRGELSAGTSVTLLLDTLFGGLLMHVLSHPGRLTAQHRARYLRQLVDFVLSAG
ncbi:MAG: TetR family transcriptional regulator [Marmoricola sp.]|nr:TetR family transcriptional regulator [Marmoricola sp.]